VEGWRVNYTIIGGTGTLGRELIRQLRIRKTTEITVLSRDECKQQQLVKDFPGVHCIIGDVRDRESLRPAVEGADAVFHVAAMKHLDVVEKNPEQALLTNVQGTFNVAKACEDAKVKWVAFSSTDKAVEPVNIYGHTKAICERYLLARNNRRPDGPRYSVYRWGNVLGSRGSVVHTFADALKKSKPIPMTDHRMTRFWINIEDAVRYMLETFRDAKADKVMVPEMKAATVVDLAKAVAYVLGVSNQGFERIGPRKGEKLHESLKPGLTSDAVDHYTPRELVEIVRRAL